MDYNNYYPAQSGHPPHIVTNQVHQHGGPQMHHHHAPPNGSQMMHSPMPHQNINRQAMPPGPTRQQHHHQHQQQMQEQHQQHPQQQQLLGHHSQQISPQQQHPGYRQLQSPHPHGPPMLHSRSPHLQMQQQHHHLNQHQPSLAGSSPQQSVLQQPSQQQHHMHHPQSPHHHAGQPMHMQHQQPQQQQHHINQMVRSPLGPSFMNHPQSGSQQPQHHQNFFNTGPIQHSTNHYPQQSQHHPRQQPQPQPPPQQQPPPPQQQQPPPPPQQQPPPPQQHRQSQVMHQHATPSSSASNHSQNIQQGKKSSPHPNILQTEFRIIELNRRLQCRPISTKPASPLPNHINHDEILWWERFASEFFEDDAILTLRIHEDKPVEFTIGRTLIPRFFRKYFDGGVTDLSINLRNPKEARTHSQLITLDCDQAFISTNIFDCPGMPRNMGLVVHTEGHLILDFVSNNQDTLSIKSWKFFTKGSREYIDRSIATIVRPGSSHFAEPAYEQGISKSTIFYLKMCMMMEPMQEVMHLHKTTNLDPRSCLRKYLFDKYKFKSDDDIKVMPNKRRKRKAPATPSTTGATRTKKSKASANATTGNSICNDNSNNSNSSICSNQANNNLLKTANNNASTNINSSNKIISNSSTMISPSSSSSFQMAPQDIIVTPEPAQPEESTSSQTATVEVQTIIQPQEVDNLIQLPQQPVVEPAIAEPEQIKEEPMKEEIKQDFKPQSSEELALVSKIVEPALDSKIVEPACEVASDSATVPDSVECTEPAESELVEHPQPNEEIQAATKEEVKVEVREEHPKISMEEPMDKENHLMNSIPEDCEDTCRSALSDSLVSKLPPNSNSKNTLTSNGTSNKQNRRRSSERKETLREGLMRPSDFVVALKDLSSEHPNLWRITNNGSNGLLQQFKPISQNGVVLYENTCQYGGWNSEIKKDYVGVDVKLTQHTRNNITVERLLLNFQELEDANAFYDRHFTIYLQVIISLALDARFWESIETEQDNYDYFITSRRIVEDITKRFKNKLSSRLKLSETIWKNVEKYPNLLIKPSNKEENQLCRACNTNLSINLVAFGNRSYDMRTYKSVKVTNDMSKSEDKDLNNIPVCGACLEIVKHYSELHHMGWKLYHLAREKAATYWNSGKPINDIIDDMFHDESWISTVWTERDSLWSKVV